MKKLLMTAVIACMAGWSSAAIVAYWDGDQGNIATAPAWQDASLVSATLGAREVSTHSWGGKGSDDETFGTIGTPAAPTNTVSWQIKDGEFQTFEVTNDSGSDLELNSIHFDYAHIFDAMNVKLTYDSGDLSDTDGTLLAERNTTGQVDQVGDWEDADVDLSVVLTDRILAPGETAVFRFDFDVAGTGASGLDNIAIDAGDNPTYIETDVVTPTISPNGGTYLNSVLVALNTTTPGASLYYTTNGITPDTNSTLYTAPFTLTGDATVKVIGIKTGLNPSDVVSADFVVEIETEVAVPTIFPDGGNFEDSVLVTLDTTTEGASLYYTTDGSTPDTNSTLYAGSFTLTNDATVKVIGTKAGLTSSDVVSADFTVGPAVPSDIVAYWDGDQGFDAAGDPPAWQNTDLVSATLGPKGVSSHKWSGKASTDGTFGTRGSPVAPNNTLSWQIKDGEFQTFSVTNVSPDDLQLNSIHFDYAHIFGALTVNLSYESGDLSDADGTPLSTHSTTGQVEQLGDWEDADVVLSGLLTDTILAPGEGAVFRFDFVGGVAGLDNIAIGAGEGASVEVGYEAWASLYSLTNGPSGDHDGDALINLHEYGLGGNPTNAADTGYSTMARTLADGGTNWFEYVYPRRTTLNNGLTYSLEVTDDLVFGTWTSSVSLIEIDSGVLNADFESVTNRIPTDGKTEEFIRLIIE